MSMMGDYEGPFIVYFNKITLSDPCYEKGIWCAQEITAKPGTWNAYVARDEHGNPEFLSAVHDDFDIPYDELGQYPQEESDTLGVDSGQMCIWDSSDYTSADSRYNEIGEGTLSDDACYLGGCGIASRTKYGDGGYVATLYYESEEPNAEVIAIEFDFR